VGGLGCHLRCPSNRAWWTIGTRATLRNVPSRWGSIELYLYACGVDVVLSISKKAEWDTQQHDIESW
jgi:hypothetical protein